jgi:hypothetical protein
MTIQQHNIRNRATQMGMRDKTKDNVVWGCVKKNEYLITQ